MTAHIQLGAQASYSCQSSVSDHSRCTVLSIFLASTFSFYFLYLLLDFCTRQIRGDGIGAFLTSIQADVDATTAAGSTTMTEEKEEDSKMDEE